MMKTWPLFFIIPLLLACNNKQQQDKNAVSVIVTNNKLKQNMPALKSNIIGNWAFKEMYAGIDTNNTPNFPDINLQADISFYNDGKFKKSYVYYTIHNKQKKPTGYTSEYKVNGDTLFIYEPTTKHWYALYAIINSKSEMEIGSRKGYSHLDTHYYFSRSRR